MAADGRYIQSCQETLTAFGLVYGFLGKALYRAPDAAFVSQLFADNLFADWPLEAGNKATQTGLTLLKRFGEQWDTRQFTVLTEDYNALFVGPDHPLAYPWESVYLSEEHLLFDTPTLEVRAIYREFGLQAPSASREPDDHVGLELAFMAHLCGLGLNACEHNDMAALGHSLQAQHNFLTCHLLRWAPTCLQFVIEQARTDYYRGLAYLGMGTLETAARLFDLKVQAVELK